MKKLKFVLVLAALSMLTSLFVSCNGFNPGADGGKTYPTDIFTVNEAGSCGISLRGTKEPLTVFTDGSAASDITASAASVAGASSPIVTSEDASTELSVLPSVLPAHAVPPTHMIDTSSNVTIFLFIF